MSNVELDTPEAATVVAFVAIDGVGRVRLESGEELRFGASAWKEGGPSIGAAVFVTAVGPHPMGGRRAVGLRLRPISEAAARAEVATLGEATAQAAEKERQARRVAALTTTTHEEIVARVRAAAPPDSEDEDIQLLHGIAADLELVGPSLDHVKAILQGIGDSPPMSHFGSPGALVHYMERFTRKGYEEALLTAARLQPTAHLFWMLARCSKAGEPRAEDALAVLRSYLTDPRTPAELRDQVESLLAKRAPAE